MDFYTREPNHIDPITRELFGIMTEEQKKVIADKMYERITKGIETADYSFIIEKAITQSGVPDLVKNKVNRAIDCRDFNDEISSAFQSVNLPEIMSKAVNADRISERLTDKIIREIGNMDIKMWTKMDD